MKRGDRIILMLCLLLAAAPLLLLRPAADAQSAVIRVDGAVVRTLPLAQDTSVRLEADGGYNVIVVRDGQVSVSQADCPDKTCVTMGAISRTGEILVCLPHRLTVTLTGAQDGIDAVSK